MITNKGKSDYLQEAIDHIKPEYIQDWVVDVIIRQLKKMYLGARKFEDYTKNQIDELRYTKKHLVYSGAIEQWVFTEHSYLSSVALEIRLTSGKIIDFAKEHQDDLDSDELRQKITKYLLGRMRPATAKLLKQAVSGDDFLSLIEDGSFSDYQKAIKDMSFSEMVYFQNHSSTYRHNLPVFYNAEDMAEAKKRLEEILQTSDDLDTMSETTSLYKMFDHILVSEQSITWLLVMLEFNKVANKYGKRLVWDMTRRLTSDGEYHYLGIMVEDITTSSNAVLISKKENYDNSLLVLGQTLIEYGLEDRVAIRDEDGYATDFATEGIQAWDEAALSVLSGTEFGLKSVESVLSIWRSPLEKDKKLYQTLLDIIEEP